VTGAGCSGTSEPVGEVRHSTDVEIKWGVHPRGDERAAWVTGEERTAMLLLISAASGWSSPAAASCWPSRATTSCGPRRRPLLVRRGESVVLTVRWPSVPATRSSDVPQAARCGPSAVCQ